jgi:hypothetical protein
MPAGINRGRTRADRKTLTAPVTSDEKARAEANARAKGVSLAEWIRLRCCR